MTIKLTTKNARRIQNSLHESYHDSNIKILESYLLGIYHITIEALFYAEDRIDARELVRRVLISRDSQGVYSPLSKTSYVFKFNIIEEDNEVKQLCAVWTLIHELRHHFQHNNNKKLLKIAEKDAERFAYKTFDKNYYYYKKILKEEINE